MAAIPKAGASSDFLFDLIKSNGHAAAAMGICMMYHPLNPLNPYYAGYCSTMQKVLGSYFHRGGMVVFQAANDECYVSLGIKGKKSDYGGVVGFNVRK